MEKGALRNTAIFGPALQVMFFVAAGRTQMALEEFYLIFVLILIAQALIYWMDTGEKVLSSREYRLGNLIYQAPAGVALGLLITSPFLVWGTPKLSPSLPADVVTQALFVAFVETVFLVVTVRTLRIGHTKIGWIVWPFLFGFSHAPVRNNWMVGQFPMESIFAFLYAALFGVLFWLLMAGNELAPEKYRILFGPVTSWAAHLTINMVILIFMLMVAGFSLLPLATWW